MFPVSLYGVLWSLIVLVLAHTRSGSLSDRVSSPLAIKTVPVLDHTLGCALMLAAVHAGFLAGYDCVPCSYQSGVKSPWCPRSSITGRNCRLKVTTESPQRHFLFVVVNFEESFMSSDRSGRDVLVVSSSCPSQSPESAGRRELLKSHMLEVFAAHADAVSEGLNVPVVYLVDCESKLGQWVAEPFRPESEIHTETSHGSAVRVVEALPLKLAAKLCVGLAPDTRRYFSQLAGQHEVPVVVWAGTGFSLYTVRLDGNAAWITVTSDVTIHDPGL